MGKQANKHVCIFNEKYVWSTLADYIKYDYFEVLRRSSVALIYLGHRRYAILRKKPPESTDNSTENRGKTTNIRGRSHGHKSSSSNQTVKRKTTCRTTGKKSASVSTPRKHLTSLQERRKEKYGIDASATVDFEKYGRGKCSALKNIDYLKLNEGLDTPEATPTSPKWLRITSHTPVRSGPTPQRQIAQKQVTINPTVTTVSTVKTKKDSGFH